MKPLMLVTCLCAFAACRPDMADQPYVRPLAEDSFFDDGAGSRPLPPRTVARGELHENEPYFTGKVDGRLISNIPVPVTPELLSRGRQRFEIYCSVCHGRTGDGNGIIVQRGFPRPPSLQDERLRAAPAGHFFDVITNGYGVMYPYASSVTPADRWAIAAYIRALQFSQHAGPENAEPSAHEKPEGATQ